MFINVGQLFVHAMHFSWFLENYILQIITSYHFTA